MAPSGWAGIHVGRGVGEGAAMVSHLVFFPANLLDLHELCMARIPPRSHHAWHHLGGAQVDVGRKFGRASVFGGPPVLFLHLSW
jgi:hypothetical protein